MSKLKHLLKAMFFKAYLQVTKLKAAKCYFKLKVSKMYLNTKSKIIIIIWLIILKCYFEGKPTAHMEPKQVAWEDKKEIKYLCWKS